MKNLKKFLLLLIPAISLCACEREPQYPIIPEITEYTGFKYYVDEYFNTPKGTLSFTFTDGDGDVGLSEADTVSPFDKNSEYHYNLHIYYYEKQYGEFVKVETPQPLHTRIPVLSNHIPESIEVKFSIDLDMNPLSEFDTVRLEFFIYDRKLHKSNVMTTPELVLPRK